MKIRWLAALPAIGLLVGTPLVNDIDYPILGLPMLLVWEVACTIAASLALYIIYSVENKTSASTESVAYSDEADSL